MDASHDVLRHEPGDLAEREQLHGAVCVALIDDILLRQSPESVIIPVDETLFQKPGILIRPDHFLALSGAVPKSEHANIESVNKL